MVEIKKVKRFLHQFGAPTATLGLAIALTGAPCATAEVPTELPSLNDAAAGRFVVGVAIDPPADLDDPTYAQHIAHHYGSLTAGNVMKPDGLQRERGRFTFKRADALVDFAEAHGLEVVGHTLVWHSQAPSWLFEDEAGQPLPREQALTNLREHIHAVVGRYRGRIKGWDVVNEAISGESEYLRDTPALRAIGDDYLIHAFRFAHETDPDAELYYNDYNIEADDKRPKALRLIRELQAAGVRLDAVGIQGHWLLRSPSLDELRRGLDEWATLGVDLHITELDVDPLPRQRGGGADVTATERGNLDPYVDGLPDEMQQELADRYAGLFALFLDYPQITRVTFWGSDDGRSWLNFFPTRGRTNHPLLFDRQLQPKPAFVSVIQTLRDAE